nr:MAG TPA: hypothetical protein [Caudoviricetes sp.]
MWTERFVRSLKYDAVPRTKGLIELLICEAYASFDTAHATESQYVNYTECVVMTLKAFQPAMERPYRSVPVDS